MSEEKKDAPQKPLNVLTKDSLRKQIENINNHIADVRMQISIKQEEVQMNLGILKYSEHLLANFELPEKVEEKKPEDKKSEPPPLEVK